MRRPGTNFYYDDERTRSVPKSLKSQVVFVDLPSSFLSNGSWQDLKDRVIQTPHRTLPQRVIQGPRRLRRLLVTGSLHQSPYKRPRSDVQNLGRVDERSTHECPFNEVKKYGGKRVDILFLQLYYFENLNNSNSLNYVSLELTMDCVFTSYLQISIVLI